MAASRGRSAVVETSINESRGQALKKRRLSLGIKSISQLHRESGLSREAITAAEEGHGSTASYERLEAWFDRFEHETGSEAAEAAEHAENHGIVEFTVDGDFGVKVVVRGPIQDVEALERSVGRIVASIREGQKEDPEAK
jgi:transcriptional regulator with XRE-family HTH domain